MNGSKKMSQGKLGNAQRQMKNKNTPCQNLKDTVKAIFSGKFKTLNAYIKNNNKLISQFCTLRNYEKKNQLNPKPGDVEKQ